MRGRSASVMRALTGAAVAVLGLLGPAVPVLPAAGTAAAPLTVPCSAADTRTELTASAVLDPSCTYTAGFDITASDVTLDCGGAEIRSPEGAGGVGIEIRTPVDVALHDVTVTGCHVSGFLNSLRVTRTGFRSLAAGHEYDTPTSAIRVVDNEMEGSQGVAVYVDGYVSDVTVERNRLHDAGSTGVYLETGSRRNHVLGNEITHNGYAENGTQGTPVTFAGTDFWFWGTGREGIAVDGSYENEIRGNTLTDNSAGGVFLYDNCGEYAESRPDAYLERRHPAARNLVEDNTFEGGRNGVWVGSRMGENTLPMECGKPAYVDRPGLRVVLDRADHNTVRGNRFRDVTYGVRVEDDHTVVAGNSFTAATPDHHAVIIGTPHRTEVLHRPVTGTVLTDNRSTIAGNASPYRWVHGQTATVVTGNRALGRAVGICEGKPVPRQAFIFAIAVVDAPADGSPPDPPDLTVPELGALPACATPDADPVPTAAGADAISGEAAYTG